MKYAAIIIILILVAGCAEEGEEKEERKDTVTIPGHNVIYQFSSDLRESINVPSTDEMEIQNAIWNSDRINIIFNSTSLTDNAYFAKVSTNIVSKLNIFFNNNLV